MNNYNLSYFADENSPHENFINVKANFIKIMFIIGILLTTAKGIRIGGDIGLGEISCLLFVLFSLTNNRSKTDSIFYVNNLFWFTIFLTLFIGLFIRLNFTNFDFPFPRTLLAYAFCYIVILGIFKSNIFIEDVIKTLKIYVGIIIIISGLFSLLILTGIQNFLGVNLYWEGSTRFQGWSLDPNQFTLIYIIAPFMLLFLYQRTNRGFKMKFKYSLYALLILIPVLSASSDSIIVSWALASIFLLMNYIRKKLNVYKLILIIFSVILVSIKSQDIFKNIELILIELFFKDGQGIKRLTVWAESIDIIKTSPLFGLGPDMGRYTEYGGSLGEAHNNFLQLGMGSGIIGILALFLYFYFILIKVIKSKNILLLGALISLVSFGLTHYTLRHPSYWFMLLLIYGLAQFEYTSKKNSSRNYLNSIEKN